MGRSSKDIDWEKCEREYRLGIMTFAEMSKTFAVNGSTITRRAKKEGWSRDLSALVKLETKAKVSAQVVEHAHVTHKERISKDAQAVEVEAISNSLMIASQERGSTKGKELMEAIIDRVTEQVRNTPTLDELLMLVKDQDPEAMVALYKVTSLPSLVDSGKKAIEGHNRAVDGERKARGLDDITPPDDERTKLLRKIVDAEEVAAANSGSQE